MKRAALLLCPAGPAALAPPALLLRPAGPPSLATQRGTGGRLVAVQRWQDDKVLQMLIGTIWQNYWFRWKYCNEEYVSLPETDVTNKVPKNIIDIYDNLNIGEKTKKI